MQSLVENLVVQIKSFLDQRDFVGLAVSSTDNETPVVWKILEGVEGEASSELFWMYQEPFLDTPSYVAAIIAAFRQRHELVRLLQPEQGMVPWPEIPEQVQQLESQPVEQLKALIRFSRELLPDKAGFGSVWAFYPFAIESTAEYSRFMLELMKHEFPFPWFSGTRIIFRQLSQDMNMSRCVALMERTRSVQVDLSPSAINASIESEINDDSLPLERQMQNVMVSAGIDFSHRRYDLCLEKYSLLFSYHVRTGDRTQLALALNGIGETQLAMGRDDAARDSFLSAILPASEDANVSVPVLTNILLNLTGYYEKHAHWQEAEGCLLELQRLAALQRNPQLKVLMLERLGIAQHAQGKHTSAIETWNACETVSAQLEIPETRENVLERLRSAYLQQGDVVQVNRVSVQLSELRSGARHG